MSLTEFEITLPPLLKKPIKIQSYVSSSGLIIKNENGPLHFIFKMGRNMFIIIQYFVIIFRTHTCDWANSLGRHFDYLWSYG